MSAAYTANDVWAPGVFKNFLREVTKSRASVSGGVFVGSLLGQLRIEGVIAIVSDGRASTVVLDDEAWKWVESVWREFYSKQSLVGWYCSRPGLGAVPTERDIASHRACFGGSEAILVCVDPAAGLMVGYAVMDNGDPVEIVRGALDLPALEQPKDRPFEHERAMTRWAIGAGVVAGVLLFLATGMSGWPFT